MAKQQSSNLIGALAVTPEPNRRGFRCGVHRILQTLAEEERQAVQDRIDEIRRNRALLGSGKGGVTSKWLAEVLTDAGHPVSELTMNNHIRKSCACGY